MAHWSPELPILPPLELEEDAELFGAALDAAALDGAIETATKEDAATDDEDGAGGAT